MTRTTQVRVLGAIAAIALGVWAWNAWWPGDERVIRRRLDALTSAVNQAAPEGIGTVTRAAEIGTYFSDDVVIDLGAGSPPIQGRESVIGVAARVTPRAGGYTLEFDDVTVQVDGSREKATVNLVAILTGNEPGRDRTTDARELQLALTKTDGTWRIAQVTALDTLRRE